MPTGRPIKLSKPASVIKPVAKKKPVVVSPSVSQIKETEELLKTPRFTESQHMSAYADIFYTLREIIRLQEARCLNSEKTTNIYALMQLYNQLRDTIHDIRAASDFTQLSHTLVHNIIRPMLTDISQNTIDIIFYLKKEARHMLQPREFSKLDRMIDTYMIEHGRYVKEYYQRVTDQIDKAFKSK